MLWPWNVFVFKLGEKLDGSYHEKSEKLWRASSVKQNIFKKITLVRQHANAFSDQTAMKTTTFCVNPGQDSQLSTILYNPLQVPSYKIQGSFSNPLWKLNDLNTENYPLSRTTHYNQQATRYILYLY